MALNITDDISFDAEQTTSIPQLSVQSSNLMANFASSDYPESIQIIVECLKFSVLSKAFTHFHSMPQSLLNLAFSTAVYQKESEQVQFEVIGGKRLSIKKKGFVRLLGLPVDGNFVTPNSEDLIAMFNQMGYTPFMTKISQFKKNKLPVLWNFFFTMFKRSLCGRKSGLDAASQLFLTGLYGVYADVKVDYGSILWYEFIESLKISTRDTELSSHRFWSIILHSAYNHEKIPFDTIRSPHVQVQSLPIPSKFADQTEFTFVGQVPETMLRKLPNDNVVLVAYRATLILPYPIREIPSEVQAEISAQGEKQSKKRKVIMDVVIPDAQRTKKLKDVAESSRPHRSERRSKKEKKKEHSSRRQQLRD